MRFTGYICTLVFDATYPMSKVTFKDRINEYRRKLTKRLTKDVGHDFVNPPAGPDGNAGIKRILISRPNHRLGNQLLLTPLVQELEATFPGCKIDLFVRGGLSHVLFKNYNSIGNIIKVPKRPLNEPRAYFAAWKTVKTTPYDLAINVIHGSSSGAVSVNKSKARYKIFNIPTPAVTEHYEDYRHLAKNTIYTLREELGKLGFTMQTGDVPVLDIKLSADELQHGKAELEKLTGNDKKTIGIFTFATGNKCYGPEWWNPVYETLKKRFPKYNIVEVLPAENVSQIGFAAPSFYSNDIREITAFMAATEVFIAADSGMMHLASASKTPTLGLFGVTQSFRYGPYGNGSIAVDTNVTGPDALADLVETALKNRR